MKVFCLRELIISIFELKGSRKNNFEQWTVLFCTIELLILFLTFDKLHNGPVGQAHG